MSTELANRATTTGFSCSADRVGWALRARACRCAAVPVEQGPHPQPYTAGKQNGPHKAPMTVWRWRESCAEDALWRPARLKLVLSDSAPGRAQSQQVGCSALAVAR